jgi:hypothetical protein
VRRKTLPPGPLPVGEGEEAGGTTWCMQHTPPAALPHWSKGERGGLCFISYNTHPKSYSGNRLIMSMPISKELTFWERLDLEQKTTAAAEFGLTAPRTLGHYGAESPWEKRRELWLGPDPSARPSRVSQRCRVSSSARFL